MALSEQEKLEIKKLLNQINGIHLKRLNLS